MTSASDGTTTVNYEYDALGRRTKRTQGASVTKFTYDGLDVLVDDNAGTLTKYLNGLGIDSKLRVQTGSSVNYFLTDHLGSTNGLADSTGNLTASTSYDSFGNATNTSFPTRYQFTGREFDSDTGLHYYRARWYDAQLGRFISEDPIGFAGGDINLFGYVVNNPINRKDPKGTVWQGVLIGGAILGEAGLHMYLMKKSYEEFPNSNQDRQRHCWVTCMSARYHMPLNIIIPGLGLTMPITAGLGKEGRDIIAYGLGYDDSHGSLGEVASDSARDMLANGYGMIGAFAFSRSCSEVCASCPVNR